MPLRLGRLLALISATILLVWTHQGYCDASAVYKHELVFVYKVDDRLIGEISSRDSMVKETGKRYGIDFANGNIIDLSSEFATRGRLDLAKEVFVHTFPNGSTLKIWPECLVTIGTRYILSDKSGASKAIIIAQRYYGKIDIESCPTTGGIRSADLMPGKPYYAGAVSADSVYSMSDGRIAITLPEATIITDDSFSVNVARETNGLYALLVGVDVEEIIENTSKYSQPLRRLREQARQITTAIEGASQ